MRLCSPDVIRNVLCRTLQWFAFDKHERHELTRYPLSSFCNSSSA